MCWVNENEKFKGSNFVIKYNWFWFFCYIVNVMYKFVYSKNVLIILCRNIENI